MLLRKAEKEEFPTVQTFYWDLIDQMEGQKDTVGWTKFRMYEYLLEADDQAAGKDLFWKGCPGPLPDGSCRTPEETCNNPSCSARG